jgi:hypothetical protein
LCTTAAQPCATVGQALIVIGNTNGGVVSCIGGTGPINDTGGIGLTASLELTIDCPGGTFLGDGVNVNDLEFDAANLTLKIRHLTFNLANTASGAPAILVLGSGNLILEDCVFENGSRAALNITPNGPLNLVITNSRISNSGAGILINPAPGGSVKASFDHVTITQNNGGGVKVETTNGPVTLDVANSEITYNSGNGINVVSGAGGQGMTSIKTTVISENGAAGVQAYGANVGVLVQTTLFDENASGATSVVGGGHISTYGNNSIVGSSGSGFTATAPLN